MLLSKRLKDLRIKNNMTQKELGDKVNVTKVSICCYENGTRCPTLDTLERISEVLAVSISYLIGYDNEVKIKNSKQTINLAREEIDFILGLRKEEDLYNLIINDPKKAIDLIKKNLDN